MTLTLLALSFASLDAVAAPTTKVRSGRIIQNTTTNAGDIVVVTDGDGSVTDVSATLTIEGEREEFTLTESDTWLHGAASVALPTTSAAVTLTTYDSKNAVVATFTAVLGSDGVVSRMKRADYCGTGDATAACADVELLSADIYPAEKGYAVGFALAGADLADVAYADFTVEESWTVLACSGKTCAYETESSTTTTEVGWDDLAAVWRAPLHREVRAKLKMEVVATSHREVGDGGPTDRATIDVAPSWDDGAGGWPSLPVDGDAASVAVRDVKELADILKNAYGIEPAAALVVVSNGWSAADALPVEAEIAIEDGETVLVPANSYQVATSQAVRFSGDPAKEQFTVLVDGVQLTGTAWTDRGLCGDGTCVALAQDDDGAWTLYATAYAATPEALPTKRTVTLKPTIGAASLAGDSVAFTFEDDIAVVFANVFEWAADPMGLDIAADVTFLGAADSRGRQSTLASGDFAGSVGRDDDGVLGLSGVDKQAESPRGDILIGGEPIQIEKGDVGGYVLETPPTILMHGGYGNGYNPPTGQTQQTQLL